MLVRDDKNHIGLLCRRMAKSRTGSEKEEANRKKFSLPHFNSVYMVHKMLKWYMIAVKAAIYLKNMKKNFNIIPITLESFPNQGIGS